MPARVSMAPNTRLLYLMSFLSTSLENSRKANDTARRRRKQMRREGGYSFCIFLISTYIYQNWTCRHDDMNFWFAVVYWKHFTDDCTHTLSHLDLFFNAYLLLWLRRDICTCDIKLIGSGDQHLVFFIFVIHCI
ncbi:unnamed protein product [Heterosigma akashiwo]